MSAKRAGKFLTAGAIRRVPVADERWEPVTGGAGYEVSSLGRVYSSKRDCILRQTKDRKGYPTVALTIDGRLRTRVVHRLVAHAFVQGYFTGATVNHIDGIKDNNRAENLEWLTNTQNMAHAKVLGLTRREPGEAIHNSRLTTNQVANIKHLKGSLTAKSIAQHYGVSRSAILLIWCGRNWRHVK